MLMVLIIERYKGSYTYTETSEPETTGPNLRGLGSCDEDWLLSHGTSTNSQTGVENNVAIACGESPLGKREF